MTPHKQLFRHDPDNGIYGDCHRTAIACLLDLLPQDVPHWGAIGRGRDDYDWRAACGAFLAQHGLYQVDVIYRGDAPLSDVLSVLEDRSPAAYYLIGGQSPRGTNHTVIGCGGCIEHDPHPDGGGLIGPMSHGYWEVTFLIPLSLTSIAS